MVDTVDLILAHEFMDARLQHLCAFLVVAKGLFDDDAAPAVSFFEDITTGELFDDGAKLRRLQGHVKSGVAGKVLPFIHCVANLFVDLILIEITLEVVHAIAEVLKQFSVQATSGLDGDHVPQLALPRFLAHGASADSDDLAASRQALFGVEVIQGRHQLQARKITGCAVQGLFMGIVRYRYRVEMDH